MPAPMTLSRRCPSGRLSLRYRGGYQQREYHPPAESASITASSFCDGPIDLRPPHPEQLHGCPPGCIPRLRRWLETPRRWPKASSPEETPKPCRPGGERGRHAVSDDLLREHPRHMSGLAPAVAASAALASRRPSHALTTWILPSASSSSMSSVWTAAGMPSVRPGSRCRIPRRRLGQLLDQVVTPSPALSSTCRLRSCSARRSRRDRCLVRYREPPSSHPDFISFAVPGSRDLSYRPVYSLGTKSDRCASPSSLPRCLLRSHRRCRTRRAHRHPRGPLSRPLAPIHHCLSPGRSA
jgi:hypothetical protein